MSKLVANSVSGKSQASGCLSQPYCPSASLSARCQRPQVPTRVCCGSRSSTKTCLREPQDQGARRTCGTVLRTLLPTLPGLSDSSGALQYPDLRSAPATSRTALCKCTRCARSALGFITTPVGMALGQRRVQGAREFKRHAHMHVFLSPSLSFWLFCRFCINSCSLS